MSARNLAAASLLLLLAAPPPAYATDYYLSAPTDVTMQTALQALGLYSTQGDFNNDFDSDFGISVGTGYSYYGNTQDGGNFKLTVLGFLTNPQVSITPQPYEPGNFTSNVGKPIQPEFSTTFNPKVGIEAPVEGTPKFWVKFSWNSGLARPAFEANGLTVYPDYSGQQNPGAPPPYGGHY